MDLKKRLENVKDRINKAALKCSRDPESIHLVAVSKTIPTNSVREAIEAGVTTLGESYVQEARNKFNVLGTYPVCGILSGIYSPTRPNMLSGFLI